MCKSLRTVTVAEKSHESSVSSDDEQCTELPLETTEFDKAGETVSVFNSDAGSTAKISLPSTSKEQLFLSKQLRRDLPALARAYDRTGVSDRSAATIASASYRILD